MIIIIIMIIIITILQETSSKITLNMKANEVKIM